MSRSLSAFGSHFGGQSCIFGFWGEGTRTLHLEHGWPLCPGGDAQQLEPLTPQSLGSFPGLPSRVPWSRELSKLSLCAHSFQAAVLPRDFGCAPSTLSHLTTPSSCPQTLALAWEVSPTPRAGSGRGQSADLPPHPPRCGSPSSCWGPRRT